MPVKSATVKRFLYGSLVKLSRKTDICDGSRGFISGLLIFGSTQASVGFVLM